MAINSLPCICMDSASSYPIHPIYFLSSFCGRRPIAFPMSHALLFVFPFLSLQSMGLPFIGTLNITVHPIKPACSALGLALHPKGGIKLFRGGHSWDSRGTTVQHHCSYRHNMDGEPGMRFHPVSHGRVCPLSTNLDYDSTAQRYPWPRQPGPSTSSLPCVPQTPPNTIQRTQMSALSLVSPRPPRCLQSSCINILLVAPAAEPLLWH